MLVALIRKAEARIKHTQRRLSVRIDEVAGQTWGQYQRIDDCS